MTPDLKGRLGALACALIFAALAYLVVNHIALGHLEYALGVDVPVSGGGLFMGEQPGQGRDR